MECRSTVLRALEAEWLMTGSAPAAADRLTVWARSEPELDGFGSPVDVVARCHVRGDSEGSNALLRALLRVAPADPLAGRAVLQAVLPALAAVASRVGVGADCAW